MTIIWILLCLGTYLFITRTELQKPLEETVTGAWAIIPAHSNAAWKFLGYQFFHSSLGHLISNVWYFAIFGWILESLVGPVAFLVSTVAAGAIAVLPEQIFQTNPNLPVVGASGAVAFSMGAVLALRPESQIRFWLALIPMPHFPNTFMVPIRYLIYFWLLLQVSGLAMNQWVSPEPVAYATHLFGFGLGMLAAGLFSLTGTVVSIKETK